MSSILPRRLGVLVFATLAIAATACRDSTDPGDREPEVATIRLTVGSSVVTVAANGAVTGGPLLLTTTDQTITAEFLRADGTPEPLITSATHRFDVISGSGITFTRASAFSGSIRGWTSFTTIIEVLLFHLAENHDDLGPFPVQVRIQ
jgi:hypothetical protein